MASHKKELIWIWEEVKEEANLLHSWRDPRSPFLIFWGILIGMPQNTKHAPSLYKTTSPRVFFGLALLRAKEKGQKQGHALSHLCVGVRTDANARPKPQSAVLCEFAPLEGHWRLLKVSKYKEKRLEPFRESRTHGPRYVWGQEIREVFTYLSPAAQGRKTVFFPYKTMILT
jgi:hypothetical protein